MLFIIDEEIQGSPIIDLHDDFGLKDLLIEAIEDYIIGRQRKTVIDNEPQSVFPVSGLAQYHHDNLKKYLDSTLPDDNSIEVINGTFANFPLRHTWLKIGDAIIDLTVRQFADKEIELPLAIKNMLDCSYFASNNKDNLIYQLYRA